MKEGRKPEYPEKIPDDELEKIPHISILTFLLLFSPLRMRESRREERKEGAYRDKERKRESVCVRETKRVRVGQVDLAGVNTRQLIKITHRCSFQHAGHAAYMSVSQSTPVFISA